MSKRVAPSSPVEETTLKKQKLAHATDDGPATPRTPDITLDVSKARAVDIAIKPIAMEVDSKVVENTSEPKTKGRGKATPKEKKQSPKKPPVQEAFTPWAPTDVAPKVAEPHWGIKPVKGDVLPHPDQPSARDSDAATNPPLWEDRKFRYKRGSQYVKYFGPVAPEDAENGPDLDQEDLLVLTLIDMRPNGKHDQSPRRKPTIYHYEHGKPKDWNDMQAVKALNDRRCQAIDRITLDAPWSRAEREYLVDLLREQPDASIWELTMLHNDRFKDKESIDDTAFAFAPLSTGRTVESVRHQYMTYKPWYDRGEAPKGVRFRNDNSPNGKALRASKRVEDIFGKPNKALEKEFDKGSGAPEEGEDDNESSDEDENAGPKKTLTKEAKLKKSSPEEATKNLATTTSPTTAEDSDDEAEPEAWLPMRNQPKLDPLSESLLDLGGAYEESGIHKSPALTDMLNVYHTGSLLIDLGGGPPIPPNHDEDDEIAEIAPKLETTNNTEPASGEVLNAPGDDEERAATTFDHLSQRAVHEPISKALQSSNENKQIRELQDFRFPSEENTDDKKPATTKTVETAIVVQVQATASITEETVTTTTRRTSLHAARRISLDEDYDDGDDEL